MWSANVFWVLWNYRIPTICDLQRRLGLGDAAATQAGDSPVVHRLQEEEDGANDRQVEPAKKHI